ncbi:MAG: type I methionyl aminopeptidase, partial [Clostridia bacterium]|nr:type I methionyl aminopeptidase [Clostridia bacterium]
LNYRGYPASLCTSVDEQIVHAIPSEKVALKEGQIISLDCGLILDGWQADSAVTVGVGAISPEAQKLIRVTEACFWKAARQAVAGKRLGDISHAVQSHAEANGFGVIRALFGHGIGRLMHEDPEVPNFGEAGHGIRLRNGMTLAVEPMICSGDWQAEELDDGWTFVTCDRSPCAHYEHTIAISDDGLPRILTLPGFCWEEEDL